MPEALSAARFDWKLQSKTWKDRRAICSSRLYESSVGNSKAKKLMHSSLANSLNYKTWKMIGTCGTYWSLWLLWLWRGGSARCGNTAHLAVKRSFVVHSWIFLADQLLQGEMQSAQLELKASPMVNSSSWSWWWEEWNSHIPTQMSSLFCNGSAVQLLFQFGFGNVHTWKALSSSMEAMRGQLKQHSQKAQSPTVSKKYEPSICRTMPHS